MSLCSARSSVRQPRAPEVARRDADRRQRRPQVVAERREQCASSAARSGASARRPCAPRGTAPVRWRWPRRPPARRACRARPAGRRRRAGRWASCRPAAGRAAPRCRPTTRSCGARRRCGRGRRTRGSARAAAKASGSAAAVQRDRVAPALEERPTRRARGSAIATNARSNRRAIDRASMAIASRLSVISSTSRLRSNSRASSSRRPTRFAGPRAGDGRQVAGDEADRQEREQRHPVLRVGDRQGADRRQEEVVEAEHRDERGHGRDPEPRPRSRPAGRPGGTSSRPSPRSRRAATCRTPASRPRRRRAPRGDGEHPVSARTSGSSYSRFGGGAGWMAPRIHGHTSAASGACTALLTPQSAYHRSSPSDSSSARGERGIL